MNNKRMMLGIAIALVLMIGWTYLVGYLDKQHPEWDLTGRRERERQEQIAKQAATQPAPASTLPAFATTGPATLPATTAADASLVVTTTPATVDPTAQRVIADEYARTSDLGSIQKEDPAFALGMTLSARGAGIESITLNDYRKTVKTDDRYVFQTPSTIDPSATRPLATRSVTVNGVSHALADVAWLLERSDNTSVTYQVNINDASGPLLRVRKSFTISPRREKSDSEKGRQYEVAIAYSFENLTTVPVRVSTELNGPSTPPRELNAAQDRQVIVGYDNSGTVQVANHFVEYFSRENPTMDLTRSDKSLPLLWVGSSSVYFNSLLRPDRLNPAGDNQSPEYIQKVEARLINPDVTNSTDHQANIVLTTQEIEVKPGPGNTVTLPFRLYVGPRQRQLLNAAYFSTFPLGFDATLTIGGMCAICTFQWLINILVYMLNIFHMVVRDWGVAIICLVCLVRLLLHPVTKRSQITMSKMAKLSPEIEKLKAKHGENKEELNKAMVAFYREHGASQVMGCLPMFLQMPIWIALYSSLQSTFELRQAPFLYFFGTHLTWIKDLAKPDNLVTWSSISLPFGAHLDGLNLLPILMGIVFYLQQKYTPKPPTMTPEQAQQQKMMMVLSTLLFPLFLYNGPSGLNLYILTSTTIGMIESKIIRDHIKKRDELEKLGPVIVDAPPRKGGKKLSEAPVASKKPGFIAKVMAQLEEAKRQADRSKKAKGGK